jgi:hypothetical protein
MTMVIPTIIQLTTFSFLLVSFIAIGAFGLVKLGQPCWLDPKNHIKKDGWE